MYTPARLRHRGTSTYLSIHEKKEKQQKKEKGKTTKKRKNYFLLA